MTNSRDELPHAQPFVHNGSTAHGNGNGESEKATLRAVMLVISLTSLSIALISGAVVVIQILLGTPATGADKYAGIFGKMFVIALVYAVGWIVALIGIRIYHNLVLPIFINAFAWLTLGGIAVLYILIINKLFRQAYNEASFIRYSVVMAGAILALIGLHLLIEEHSLIYFSIPLLVISLVHLCIIVYRYVFMSVENYGYLIGDVTFFGGMAAVSVLMLMHLGMLAGARKFIDHLFVTASN